MGKWFKNIFWFILDGIILVGVISCHFFDRNQSAYPTSPEVVEIEIVMPRFFENDDGTVVDTATGLIWLKDANCLGAKTQADAMAAVNTLADGVCGLIDDSNVGDWRLPAVKELLSLLDYNRYDPALPDEHLFVNVQTWYWSSSLSMSHLGDGWVVNLSDGDVGAPYVDFMGFVLPVRGEDLPASHFSDNGDGTVIDTRTGLIWLKDAGCFGLTTLVGAIVMTNDLEEGICGLADGSKEGDWRLPDVQELLGILDYSQYNPALPAGHPFQNIQTYYWTATPFIFNLKFAWTVYLSDGQAGVSGDVGADDSGILGFVLPVRDPY
jgi:hypothetical protein